MVATVLCSICKKTLGIRLFFRRGMEFTLVSFSHRIYFISENDFWRWCDVLSTNRLCALTIPTYIQCMVEEIQKRARGRILHVKTEVFATQGVGRGEKKEPMNKLCTIEGFLLRCIILILLQVFHLHPRQHMCIYS